jgi:hypothetical protein
LQRVRRTRNVRLLDLCATDNLQFKILKQGQTSFAHQWWHGVHIGLSGRCVFITTDTATTATPLTRWSSV